MIKKDLKVFATVYVIVLMTFCGATFLSLRGLAVYDENSGFKGVAVRYDIYLIVIALPREGTRPINVRMCAARVR